MLSSKKKNRIKRLLDNPEHLLNVKQYDFSPWISAMFKDELPYNPYINNWYLNFLKER